jgi:hypothetical protein
MPWPEGSEERAKRTEALVEAARRARRVDSMDDFMLRYAVL